MSNSKKIASVIIPAFNEEVHIQDTLRALVVNDGLEIIVVDNGSTDNTAEIAKRFSVMVLDFPKGTIAAVRNRGVKETSTDILIFIDADVRVSPEWHERLPAVISTLANNPLVVTGSRVRTGNDNNWINKYWYSELSNYKAPYINSGHLITSAKLFHLVGGFSEPLETAEDYDFCQKARQAGGHIQDNPDLAVIHEGYPAKISGLILRERWHGGQDVHDWKAFVESKIAWVAALNLLLFLIAVGFTWSGFHSAIPAYFLTLYSISLLLTLYKFGIKPLDYLLLMPLFFYFYLCGRSLALLDRFVGRKIA